MKTESAGVVLSRRRMSLSAVGDDAHYGRPEKFRYDDLIPPSPAALRLPDPQHVQLFAFIPFWADHGLYPSVVEKAHLSRDPLAAEFRALWEEAGLSTALSPVFGGDTANAEFEVLCGFPVLDTGVKFERRLTNDVPCLPRILRAKLSDGLDRVPSTYDCFGTNQAVRRKDVLDRSQIGRICHRPFPYAL